MTAMGHKQKFKLIHYQICRPVIGAPDSISFGKRPPSIRGKMRMTEIAAETAEPASR
jgi:hypothetical protein